MKIGIVQGRLSPPLNGFQECPVDWEREFRLLSDLKLDHIEWIITKQSFETNPIFSEDLFFYNISSICADNLIDKNIIDKEFLKKNLDPICKSATENGIPVITIPLLEESSMYNDLTRLEFIKHIKPYASKYPFITFSFEIESHDNVIEDIIYSDPSFRLTYDTGNMTSLGVNHEYYIDKFFHRINNVHLKDRTFTSKTVWPGTGKTDFKQIIDLLESKGYNENYTIQTARGEDGKEIETILEHKNIFERLHNG